MIIQKLYKISHHLFTTFIYPKKSPYYPHHLFTPITYLPFVPIKIILIIQKLYKIPHHLFTTFIYPKKKSPYYLIIYLPYHLFTLCTYKNYLDYTEIYPIIYLPFYPITPITYLPFVPIKIILIIQNTPSFIYPFTLLTTYTYLPFHHSFTLCTYKNYLDYTKYPIIYLPFHPTTLSLIYPYKKNHP